MNHFDVAQSFIEQCERSTRIDDLAVSFRRTVEALGFSYFACCAHVDPGRPPAGAVVLHNYPQRWVRTFSELELYEIDPVFHYASRTLTPFFWDGDGFRAELTLAQREILEEAARFGIARGYTVPIHAPHSLHDLRASCSVVPDSDALHASSYSVVQLIACYMYEAADRDAASRDATVSGWTLSRRERQCLELAAQGKSDWVVGRILGLSASTIHNHIESAKRRLGVVTRVQAIVHALARRQISFGDVIRAENSERAGEARRALGKSGPRTP